MANQRSLADSQSGLLWRISLYPPARRGEVNRIAFPTAIPPRAAGRGDRAPARWEGPLSVISLLPLLPSSVRPLHHASHGPPPPRCGGGKKRAFSRRVRVRVLLHEQQRKTPDPIPSDGRRRWYRLISIAPGASINQEGETPTDA